MQKFRGKTAAPCVPWAIATIILVALSCPNLRVSCFSIHKPQIAGRSVTVGLPNSVLLAVSTSTASTDSTDDGNAPLELDSTLAPPIITSPQQSHHDTIWAERGPLFRMTRPSSIPGVVLFHMIGTYLALEYLGQTNRYWSVLLKQPCMWLTLLCENLVSSTSMIVNDYYDAKLGRDLYKQVNLQKKVLLNGQVTLPMAKRFVTGLYSTALWLVCFLPGVPTRLLVTSSLMLTYLYTKHLKPLFGVKNVVCASLVALTPWTSASAAMHLVGKSSLFVPSLWRLFASLFFGVMGREIMLDCNDVAADKQAGIDTLPVVDGLKFSSTVALGTTVCMSAIATVQPLLNLIKSWASTDSLWNALKSSPVTSRRLGFALLSSIIMLRRSWQVYATRGEDPKVTSKAVDESLITVIFLLASFV